MQKSIKFTKNKLNTKKHRKILKNILIHKKTTVVFNCVKVLINGLIGDLILIAQPWWHDVSVSLQRKASAVTSQAR